MWYIQLVLVGQPHWKPTHAVGTQTVGLDLGPSTLAAVWDDGALLERFCPDLVHDWQTIRRLQRRLDRSRRLTNPACYESNGVIKQGATFTFSKRYRNDRQRLSELYRRYAAHRKTVLGQLAHGLIALGATINTEKLSYRVWQRHWGKSIGRAAPGLFLQILRRKTAQVGGRLHAFSPRHTKFSQLCHRCGLSTKKLLSQRVHHCPGCGLGPVHRDLYSAFLARHVRADDSTLDADHARGAWSRADLLLKAASRNSIQAARIPPRESLGHSAPETSRSSAEACRGPCDALVPGSAAAARESREPTHAPSPLFVQLALFPGLESLGGTKPRRG